MSTEIDTRYCDLCRERPAEHLVLLKLLTPVGNKTLGYHWLCQFCYDKGEEGKDFAGRKNYPNNPNENPDPYLGGLPISTMQTPEEEDA